MGTDPVAVVAWHAGGIRRAVVTSATAAELGGVRQRVALTCLFGGPALELAARRARRVLGVAHNHFDVTTSARPWFAFIADDGVGLTAAALGCLLRRAEGARCHVVDVMWDTLEETRVEGGQPLRHK